MSRYAFFPAGFLTFNSDASPNASSWFPPNPFGTAFPYAPILENTSFLQAFQFHYNIKYLTLHFNYDWAEAGGVAVGSVIDVPTFTPQFSGLKERSMVTANDWADPGSINQISQARFFNLSLYGTQLYIGIREYLPATNSFSLYATFAALVDSPTAFNKPFIPGIDPPSGITFTFLGRNVPFFTRDGSADTGTIDVTAQEYWPFEKDDNTEPIFDSLTGVRLINPVPQDLGLTAP